MSLEASSATNEVVTFRRGMLNNFDTILKIEIETPTAASSTGPLAVGPAGKECSKAGWSLSKTTVLCSPSDPLLATEISKRWNACSYGSFDVWLVQPQQSIGSIALVSPRPEVVYKHFPSYWLAFFFRLALSMDTLTILSLIILNPMLICALAQMQNITLGSTLISSQNPKWVSPNGQFAFGFYAMTSTLYVVGVWFDDIPTKTLVWTAMKDQRDIPVEKMSSLQLTNSGLTLYDDQNNMKWSSGLPDNEVIQAAAMLNSGNFVLYNTSSEPIWQSFDNPTDTLLPGQTLKVQSFLFSKASTTNYSIGRFQLFMQIDGNLVLQPMEGSRRNRADDVYWSTRPHSGVVSLEFDPNGLLYLVNNTNEKFYNLTEGKATNGTFRLTLESDGILAQYMWNNSTASWLTAWQNVTNPCKVTDQCGPNGICQLNSQNKAEADCFCPSQFSFINNDDHFKGCMPSTSQEQSCNSANSTMSPLNNTEWLDAPYVVIPDVSESECQEACMEDCICVVVTYENTACSKQQMPLMTGRQGPDITTKAFVKVYEDFKPRRERETKTLIIAISISVPLLAAALLLIWFCHNKLHKTTRFIQQYSPVERLEAFYYKEIEAATGGFREELGRGSFGKVYKGALPDGRAIAVKTLVDRVEQELGEREFRTEVSVIGTSHHKNLVQLYGFCDEGSHRILVYEYMSNGSLDTTLFVDSGFLDWSVRVQIAMGIARGIRYLHEECRTQILHCDIKPQNILLDQNYNPKISDFGIAKLLRAEQTRTFTAARGTRGYMAPEWFDHVPVTVKVDVYSFGIMLLEIICCRKTLKLDAPENQIILVDWIYKCLEQGSLVELVEQQQVEGVTIELRQLERMVLVGLWCIQEHSHLRPSINNVVQMMEGKVEIAMPPPPVSRPPVLQSPGSFSISITA